MKAILINTILTLLLFFLTTPSIIMNLLNQANYKKAVEELHVSHTVAMYNVSYIIHDPLISITNLAQYVSDHTWPLPTLLQLSPQIEIFC